MSSKDTLTRAYGNTPKEIPDPFNFDDLFPRPIRYLWIKWVVRKFYRRNTAKGG